MLGVWSFVWGAKPTKSPPWRRDCDYIDLAWYRLCVEPAELSEIAVDRESFWFLLGLLSPRLSPKETLAWKWVNKWVCRSTLNHSPCEIVFSLFAKSECCIQIIKHIWTETCVFVKMSWKFQTWKGKWCWHPKAPPRHPFMNLKKTLQIGVSI